MLLENTQRSSNFLSVKHGAICLESKEPREFYELIEGEVNGNPYSKYVRKFGGVEGIVTAIEWYDRPGDYGHFRGLHIKIKDDGETYILDLPFEKRPYDTFTKVAENIDYSKPVRFEAWPDRKNAVIGQQIPTAFAVKQDDKFIQWKYTKDDMGDCPPAKQSKAGKWNFDDQRDWLLDRIVNVVAPHVAELNGFHEPMPDYTDEPATQAKATQATASAKAQFAAPKTVSRNQEPPFKPYDGEMPDFIADADDTDSSIPF